MSVSLATVEENWIFGRPKHPFGTPVAPKRSRRFSSKLFSNDSFTIVIDILVKLHIFPKDFDEDSFFYRRLKFFGIASIDADIKSRGFNEAFLGTQNLFHCIQQSNWLRTPMKSPKHHTTTVLGGLRGTLYTVPMMPRGASLPDSFPVPELCANNSKLNLSARCKSLPIVCRGNLSANISYEIEQSKNFFG